MLRLRHIVITIAVLLALSYLIKYSKNVQMDNFTMEENGGEETETVTLPKSEEDNVNLNNECEDSPYTDHKIYSRYPYVEYQPWKQYRRFDNLRY